MSISKIIVGSTVVCSNSIHSNRANRAMPLERKHGDNHKSIASKEVKGKASTTTSSILVVERPTKVDTSPIATLLQTQLIPVLRLDDVVKVVWSNLVGLVAVLHKFTHSIHFGNAMLLEMRIEKTIIDCRFFTLLAVAGSMLGSVLCFVEGCLMTIKACLHYFHASSHRLDSSGVVQLVIEAIDMFLIGTTMLIFGMGLYVMFVRTQSVDTNAELTRLNSTASSPLQVVPSWMKMHSLSQAKTRVGHAIMMILQVGILEKFKSIALVTSLDLACFAAALLVSSTSIFLLSKLSSHN